MSIRLATAADALAVQAIYAPIVESTAISFELEVPSLDEIASRITDRQPGHPWLVDDIDGDVTGYAYAGRFAPRAAYDWSVETSVYVNHDHRSEGVGRRLYTALLDVLVLQGYRQAMGGIAMPNPGSVALHERLGFVHVGTFPAAGWKFGQWHDVGWWQRPLAMDAGEPSAVVPVDELSSEALGEALLGGGAG